MDSLTSLTRGIGSLWFFKFFTYLRFCSNFLWCRGLMKVASCGVGGLMKLVWFGSRFGRRNLRFHREVCPFILITYDHPLARLSKVTACWSHRLVSTCCAMICCPGFNCAQWREIVTFPLSSSSWLPAGNLAILVFWRRCPWMQETDAWACPRTCLVGPDIQPITPYHLVWGQRTLESTIMILRPLFRWCLTPSWSRSWPLPLPGTQ